MTKLWLVKRSDRIGYDEYDSMVVACDTEVVARHTSPSQRYFWDYEVKKWYKIDREGKKDYHVWFSGWTPKPTTLTVEYLGTTDRDIKGVILASFNAG